MAKEEDVSLRHGVADKQTESTAATERHRDVDGIPTSTATSLDDAMEQWGFGRFQIMVTLICCFGFFYDGAEMLLVSLIYRPLRDSAWNISKSDIGILGSAVFTGFLVSGLTLGWAADRIGRRRVLIFSILWIDFFALAAAFSPTWGCLLFARVMTGYGIGGMALVASTMITEYCPVNRRGFILCLCGVAFPVGEVFCAFLGWAVLGVQYQYEPTDPNWRWFIAYSSVPGWILAPFIIWLLPESPRFLLVNGKLDELRELLERMGQANNLRFTNLDDIMHLRSDKDDVKGGHVTPVVNPGDVSFCDNVKKSLQGFRSLMHPIIRRTSISLWYMWFVQSFTYYGLIYVLSTILQERSGSTEDEDNNVFLASVYLALVEIPGTVVAMFMIDSSLGRRGTLIAFYVISVISVVVCMFDTPYSCFFTFAMSSKMAVSSAYSVIYPYTMEVYPTSFRGVGLGTSSAMARVGGLLTPLLSEMVVDVSWGEYFKHPTPFCIYAGLLFVVCLVTASLQIETAKACLPDTLDDEADLAAGHASIAEVVAASHAGDGDVVDEKAPLAKTVVVGYT